MEATQIIDDNEIIKAVQETTENEETEEDKRPSVSDKIALESIQNLLNYLQKSNDISVNTVVLYCQGWKIYVQQEKSKSILQDKLVCGIVLRCNYINNNKMV